MPAFTCWIASPANHRAAESQRIYGHRRFLLGCGLAQCGACSVLVDGNVVRSCVTPVAGVVGREITTIEAIETDDVGKQVVAAWVEHQVAQCGYCQSGQVMAATALLKHTPAPTAAQIDAAMVNLCRCGTYNAIHTAMDDLAHKERA